jgi:hypothetical protein
VRESPNLNRTFTVRRKAAKRSERWYQTTSAPFPQNIAAAIPARKKQRLEEPLSTTTSTRDDDDRETTLPDNLAGLGPPADDNDNDDTPARIWEVGEINRFTL